MRNVISMGRMLETKNKCVNIPERRKILGKTREETSRGGLEKFNSEDL